MYRPFINVKTVIPNLFTVVALAMLLLTTAACSDNPTEDDEPVLTGRWFGQTTVQGVPLSMEVQMQENNGIVNATGNMVFVEPLAITASGVYNFPSLSLTVTSTGFADLSFTGELGADGNSISGSMRGSGFDNFSITLRRQ